MSLRVTLVLAALLALAALGPDAALAETKIFLGRKPAGEQDTRYDYHDALVREALRRTDAAYGKAEFRHAKEYMNEDRILRELTEGTGKIHLFYRPASKKLTDELKLNYVPIPLDKGLLGYRVFLTHRDNLPRLARVHTLEEMKSLRVGQGADWSDVDIYKANGFTVILGSAYENLFRMTVKKRFDVFARGVEEAPVELAQRTDAYPMLTMDRTLLLHYPFVRFVWVAKSAAGDELYMRLWDGLESMVEDGAFDKLFFAYKGAAIMAARLDERRRIDMPNPFLPDEVKPLFLRRELWYQPNAAP